MSTPTIQPLDAGQLQERIARFRQVRDAITQQIHNVIIGQDEVIEQVLIALCVGGHCLITGLPGTAKTLLVRTIGQILGLEFRRIQFTPDLMPSDITGTDIIEEDPTTGRRTWTFVPGPIFANILLADEINRTPPKTQSALLEAMQELSCTVRGNQYKIRPPFFVLATQNPIELEGTYPLPEAQLDRFIFNVLLDYLSAEHEMQVLDLTTTTRQAVAETVTSPEEILEFQRLVRMVPIADSVARYAVNLVRATRASDPSAPDFVKKYVNFGASVRAAQNLVLTSKARALMQNRVSVSYQDVQAMMRPILRHRILLNFQAESDKLTQDDILKKLLEAIPQPAIRLKGPMLQRFLDPSVLAGISGLDLVAKTVVDGFISGLHKSPDFGFSQEFAEYRMYSPGDDLRHVDWNVFARSEKMFLKRYRGETNCQVSVLLDASRSMKYGSRGMEKMEYAKFLAASVCYLAHLQRDAAGLIVFDSEVRQFVQPSTRQGQIMRLLHGIDSAQTGAETVLEKPFAHLTDYLRRRGLVVAISDFWEDPETVIKTVGPLRSRGNELILFHVLDPQEIQPKLRGPVLMEDLESGAKMEVSPDYATHEYKSKMSAHLEDLKSRAAGAGIGYFLVDTSRPLDEALREYLAIRAGRL